MFLKRLSLVNFKNHHEANLEFIPEINCFTGNNGAGKTNMLDAVYYLALCKSCFNPIDSQNIKHGERFFIIQGCFIKDLQQETVYCALKQNKKKQFMLNGKEYKRLADHIGIFPLVMISPDDSALISEGSSERRKFLDNVISQTDNSYLNTIINYNLNLSARNVLLRNTSNIDLDLLSIYDQRLAEYGDIIYKKRKSFFEIFKPLFSESSNGLNNYPQKVDLVYQSQLNYTDYKSGIEQNFDKDKILQRTGFGIHKDELEFMLDGRSLKKFGSQGQQKTFIISLKLAQYAYLQRKKGFKPLLLLDDIFDKLDQDHINNLMSMVSADKFGQIFITDTDRERIVHIFEKINKKLNIININPED